MSASLRKAEVKDKKDILEIITLLHLDTPGFIWENDEFVEKQIENGEYFLAEMEGGVAGVISFRQREDKMYIETLAVAEEYRLQGVGTTLIEFAKSYTRENGLGILRACSFCEYKAESFYFNRGFSLLGKTGRYNNHKYHRFEIKLQ
jgi:N-acetylglutamate synthase-like GNAT family acetyltransferase